MPRTGLILVTLLLLTTGAAAPVLAAPPGGSDRVWVLWTRHRLVETPWVPHDDARWDPGQTYDSRVDCTRDRDWFTWAYATAYAQRPAGRGQSTITTLLGYVEVRTVFPPARSGAAPYEQREIHQFACWPDTVNPN